VTRKFYFTVTILPDQARLDFFICCCLEKGSWASYFFREIVHTGRLEIALICPSLFPFNPLIFKIFSSKTLVNLGLVHNKCSGGLPYTWRSRILAPNQKNLFAKPLLHTSSGISTK